MITLKGIQDKLIKIEPTRDFLHELLGCGVFEEVTLSSDGFFLGRPRGDPGFNVFLAKSSLKALARTKRYISLFCPEERTWIKAYLTNKYGRNLGDDIVGDVE